MDLRVEASCYEVLILSTVVCWSTSEFLVSVCIEAERHTNLNHVSDLQLTPSVMKIALMEVAEG